MLLFNIIINDNNNYIFLNLNIFDESIKIYYN